MARAQILEEVNRLRRPLFCHLFPPDHGDRIRQVDGRFLKGRAGHSRLFEEKRGGLYPQLNGRGLPSFYRDGRAHLRVADQLGLYFVLAHRHVGNSESALRVRHAAQIQSRDVNQSRFQHVSTVVVNHRDDDGTRRLRLHRRGPEQGRADEHRKARIPKSHNNPLIKSSFLERLPRRRNQCDHALRREALSRRRRPFPREQ